MKTHPELNLRPVNVKLENMNVEELNFFICAFLLGIRKGDGGEFPYPSLSQMVTMIQLFLNDNGKTHCFSRSHDFKPIREVLGRLKQRREANHARTAVKVEMITSEEENVLWEKGILGMDNSRSLLYAMFYIVGARIGIKSGVEQRLLKHSQFKVIRKDCGKEVLRYDGASFDTKQTMESKKIKQFKTVDIEANTDKPERCPVQIYKKYISKCEEVKSLDELESFYLRPLSTYKIGAWYSFSPTGKNVLGQVVKNMCKEAGFTGHRTNFSIPPVY